MQAPMQAQQPGYYQPMAPMAQQQDNSTLAIVLEVIGGLFGIYGIGWLVAGFTSTGLFLLIGGIVWVVIAIVLSIVTLGLFALCIFPINLAVLITSTLLLNNKLKQRRMGIVG
jgi:hypothetical protein